jgi:antitoxin MazE
MTLLRNTLFVKVYDFRGIIKLTLSFLKRKRKPREGWEQAFKEMHENGDDELLIDDVFLDE